MDVRQEKRGPVVLVSLNGRLDSGTAGPLEEQLLGLINQGETKLVLECDRLSYISSAGLRVLLVAAKKLKPLHGRLVLCSVQDHIQEIFGVAGFTTIFPIYGLPEEALREIQR